MEGVAVVALVLLILGWIIPSPLSWFTRRALEKRHQGDLDKLDQEIKLLRTHLHTKMEVDAEGMTQLKTENAKLKQIVQNLKVTNHTLSSQPEQADLRLLHSYDRAIRLMERKFPVLVPTWRTLMAHVEKEMNQVDQGLAPLTKRSLRPAKLADNPEPKLLPSNDGRDSSRS